MGRQHLKEKGDYMEPKGWKETVINYSDAASDIILFDDAVKIYKNIITGNTSEYLYKCIREGRRFIVEDSRCMHKVMSGEYAYYDEGNDSLIVTKVIFDKNTKTWKETARCVFYKKKWVYLLQRDGLYGLCAVTA